MSKNILTLDIGTKLGIYYNLEATTIPLGKGDDRFFNFLKEIEGRITENQIRVIAFEAASFQQGNAIPIYHGLVGILKALCICYGVELHGIPVGTIKKCFVGKGNANKKDMMAKCDELGVKYDDDNSADAYAVYYTYNKLIKGEDNAR